MKLLKRKDRKRQRVPIYQLLKCQQRANWAKAQSWEFNPGLPYGSQGFNTLSHNYSQGVLLTGSWTQQPEAAIKTRSSNTIYGNLNL